MCGLQRRLLFFPPSPLAHYFLLSVEGNGWVAIKQDDATSYGRPAADSGNRPVETAHISFVIMFPLGERWLLHRPFPIFFYFKRALKKKRGEKTRRRVGGRFFFPPADPRAHSPTNSGRRIYRIEKWRDAHTKKLGNERTAEQKSARDERKDEFCFDEPKKVDACAANAPPIVRGYSMCQQTLLGPELVVVSAHHKAKWTSNGRPHCFRTRGSWSFGNCCRNSAGLNAVEGFWGGRRPDHCGADHAMFVLATLACAGARR